MKITYVAAQKTKAHRNSYKIGYKILYDNMRSFKSLKVRFVLSHLTPIKAFVVVLLLLPFEAIQIFTEAVEKGNTAPPDKVVDNNKGPHYAVHHESAVRLALLEEQLALAISKIIQPGNIGTRDTKNVCHYQLTKYFTSYEADAQSLPGLTGAPKAKAVAEHPLLTFKMIRRIFVTLFNESISLCQEDRIEEMVKNLFDEMDLTPPVNQDYQDALLGILRIHFVYGFKADQIQQGIFNDVHTNVSLSLEDCLALANKAISKKLEVLAYQWKQVAISINSESLPLKNTWTELMNLTNVGTVQELHAKLGNKIQEMFEDAHNTVAYDYYFYGPCRGEAKPMTKYDKELVCTLAGFDWDPFFTISPVKLEVLSKHPLVWQVYDFVGESQMEFIKRSAGGTLKRSRVENFYSGKFSNRRCSMNTYLKKEYEQNPMMVGLNTRLEKLIDLEVIKDKASFLQVVTYGSLGGYFDYHYDVTFDPNHSFFKDGLGNRIATFLMFLSEVKMGGYTAFPKLKLHVKPVKGSAVFWYSLRPNGKTDFATLHGGCPLVLGHKTVANRWMHGYENMFKYYCV